MKEAEAALDLDTLDAVLLDMDGVLTNTAEAHAAAWKRMFDAYLKARAEAHDETFVPFDRDTEYREYVDGKPRFAGVRDFLAARGIELPEGGSDDSSDSETVHGLGKRKNEYFQEWLEHNPVQTYESSLALIRILREQGIRVAVFSASRNAERVLRNAGILDQFDARVDGQDMDELDLEGKPAPAILFEACKRLDADTARTAVIEDSAAGVAAGRRGGFATVIGVDRDHGPTSDLRGQGADQVVSDLGEIAVVDGKLCLRSAQVIPDAWAARPALQERFAGNRLILFLDYDGTLTPIVEDRTRAELDDAMRNTLQGLAKRYRVAVISGRDLKDVRDRVQLDNLFYAGSHGFEIAGPGGLHHTLERGEEFLPELDQLESELDQALADIAGHDIERKRFAIAVHYRGVEDADIPELEAKLDRALKQHPALRKSQGKRVFQIQPDIDWDKGRALQWILERLDLPDEILPLYIGDDVTDEDAFRVLATSGIGILVRDGEVRFSAADYSLADTQAVRRLLEWLMRRGEQAA